MSLLGDVRAAAQQQRKVSCPVAFAYEALPPEDRADLSTLLADEGIPGAAIQRVLVARGHRMGSGAVATHRAGRCSCRAES